MKRVPDLLRLATVDVSPLRHRDFRLLFWGQLVSFLGSQVTYVAVPYQVYQLTQSPLLVGLLGLAELVTGAGAVDARRRHRRRARSAHRHSGDRGRLHRAVGAAARQRAAAGAARCGSIFVLAAAQAGLFALQRPSMDALVPRLVERVRPDRRRRAHRLRGTVGMLLGPAIGGVLIVLVGLPATYGARRRQLRGLADRAVADARRHRRPRAANAPACAACSTAEVRPLSGPN